MATPKQTFAKKILSVALHATLAETRSLLIRSVGHDVKTVYTLQELQQACSSEHYDLLMVSQGISEKEKRRIVLEFRKTCPQIPVLELFEVSPELPEAEFSFHTAEGPAELTKKLKTVLEHR